MVFEDIFSTFSAMVHYKWHFLAWTKFWFVIVKSEKRFLEGENFSFSRLCGWHTLYILLALFEHFREIFMENHFFKEKFKKRHFLWESENLGLTLIQGVIKNY